MNSRKTLVLVGLAALAGGPAAGAQEKQLTAREMFYAAPAAAKAVEAVKPASTAKPKPPETGQPKSQQTVAQTKPKPPETVAQTKPKPPERTETAASHPAQTGKIIPVAYRQRVPLGVRYSLMKRTESGLVEVDPGGTFRAGDRIRVSIEVNDTAYLYIVNRGSSGAWKVLFPSPEVQDGDNRVEPGRRYQIPSGHVFTFDEQPGVEKLFLVLSRQPEADLENLIYTLSRRPASGIPPALPPAVEPPAAKPEKLLLAQNVRPIDDGLIGRLRNTYARDLIIEKVDESTPGPKKEQAVYVVNTTGRDDARVVVDIDLNHQ